jgi:hypothetical protein
MISTVVRFFGFGCGEKCRLCLELFGEVEKRATSRSFSTRYGTPLALLCSSPRSATFFALGPTPHVFVSMCFYGVVDIRPTSHRFDETAA